MNMLERIKKGNPDSPQRILLYGVEGIGKSTWASHAPGGVFLCSEDGLGPALNHVDRIVAENYQDVLATIDELRSSDHKFQTIIVDTVDWLEPLIHDFICARDGKTDIEAYGYGKGYTAAQTELRKLLAQLDLLRRNRRMGVIFLAHSMIKTFQNPTGDNYDRYIMKGNEKFSGLLKEWLDEIFFARYEVYVKKDSKTAKKGKGVGEARVMHTNWTAAWDGKNKLGLPDVLPLDWDAFMQAIGGGGQVSDLTEQIVDQFKTAEWPDAKLRDQFVKRLGGEMTKAALVKVPVGTLLPAADYLKTLQPAKEEVAESFFT